jgi:hypothetical protein
VREAEKERYIKFGCGTLVADIERKDKLIDELTRSIDVVLAYIKRGEEVPVVHVQAMEEASTGALIERGV